MSSRRRFPVAAFALLLGLTLLVVTLERTDLRTLGVAMRSLGVVFPLVMLPSAAWHVARTLAWRHCFPVDQRPGFWQLFRVRLAAEAFSFLTIRGVAGEPLKVMLLRRQAPAALAAAAVAFERIAYILVTALVVAIASAWALAVLPLTAIWQRIFAVSALSGAAICVLPLIWLAKKRESSRPRSAGSFWMRRIFRFSGFEEFRAQWHRVIGEERSRLLLLSAFEVAAYGLMALEVWTVWRATHVQAGVVAAFAVETFTRVASMASAFIPANIGALEASNVAAAAAVHVSGGAVALALVRRLRGLFWCIAGFAVYPRIPENRGSSQIQPEANLPTKALALVEHDQPNVFVSDVLGGLPVGERILRAAIRAGYGRVLIWSPMQSRHWAAAAKHFQHRLAIGIAHDVSSWQRLLSELEVTATIPVVMPDVVPSAQLLMAARDGDTAATFLATRAEVGSPHHLADRIQPDSTSDAVVQDPFFARIRRRQDLAHAEKLLRLSVFKSTDGRLGRFNRRVSLPLSIALIRSCRCSPHVMSIAVMVLGFVAGWFFSRGSYATALMGAVISSAASVLDGCDGELARLQHKDSSFGCWLDTLGDYTYYLSIFIGMTIGSARLTGWSGFWWIGAALLTGTLLTFGLLIVLRRKITDRQPERLRTTAKAHFYGSGKRWAWLVAKLSNAATRANAPYGILLLALFNLVPLIVVLAAIGAQIYWISLAIELRRLLDPSRRDIPRSAEPAF